MSEPPLVTGRFLLGRARDMLTTQEQRVLDDAVGPVRDWPARKTIVRTGDAVDVSTYLVEGYAARYMDDREGHRQLLSVHVPGDFIDLHGFALKRLDHDVATLGPAKLAFVDHHVLAEVVRDYPAITRAMWFSTLLDAALHREWIFRLGRLDSQGRVASFFCEMEARLRMVGLSDGGSFALPFTQGELAEACGVTGVHVNRTLRALREQEMVTFRDGVVAIMDGDRLRRLANFDPAYLYGDMSATMIEARREEGS